MEMHQKTNFTIYFKKESVTIAVSHSKRLGDSYIAFNCYALQSRKKFNKFHEELRTSRKNEFDNVNDLYGLARKYDLRAVAGHKPTIVDTIAF